MKYLFYCILDIIYLGIVVFIFKCWNININYCESLEALALLRAYQFRREE